MKIINWRNKAAAKVAVRVINSGGILVYPTDTIYGFGVNAKDPVAIDKLNALKNRTGPISVIAPDKATVSTWLNVKEEEKLHAANHLDAQNTIIYPVKKNIVHKKIMGPQNTLGIRIPNHPFCKIIANSCTLPITTTSVNRTGEPPRNNVDEILNSFPTEIDLIIEDGDLVNSASKIYMYNTNGLKKIR
jgi:L-threonylcarbamoyladenylate synthase